MFAETHHLVREGFAGTVVVPRSSIVLRIGEMRQSKYGGRVIGESARVVLVEDNVDDVELLTRALQRGGLREEVHRIADGAAALAYLLGAGVATPGPVPALVLLDLHLPLVNGFEVLRRLRASERTMRVPIVVLLGSSSPGDARQALELGANAVVGKSARGSELRQVLRHCSPDLTWTSDWLGAVRYSRTVPTK